MRWLVLAIALVLTTIGGARADPAKQAEPAVDPSIGRVEVTLQLPRDKPYVGEMIMLTVRTFIRAFIERDEIRQPALTNFDSQQLGRDTAISAMVDGFRVGGLERHIAIFPQQSGRLIIEPFIRHVTIVTDDNHRVQADFASKPVYVDVQNHDGIADAGEWWLPAKALTLTDNWSVAPDEIKPGTLARRTVTLEAVGLTAERLPPAPKVLAPGTIAFRGPAKRETIVTDDGPIARATYQWDIRPVSASPAKLPLIQVRWFDTGERRMRTASIPETWVAYIGTLVHTAHEQAKTWSQIYLSSGPIAAGVAGFVWTATMAGLLLRGRRAQRGAARRRARTLRDLRRAARYNDETGFRTALGHLIRHDPERWARVLHDPLIAQGLVALDAARYGRAGGASPPLAVLAADISRLITQNDDVGAHESGALPRLDGPPVATSSWQDRLRRRLA